MDCLCGYRRRCEAPHLFPLLQHLGTAGGVQPISVANPFLNVFISMCRLRFGERKTWSRARFFPEIQEKEMGLLNKIDCSGAGVPQAGCTGWQRSPPPRAMPPTPRGCACREHLAGLGSSPAAGMASVRSALGYSGENPEDSPDR